ncbi:MAG: zf-HC2 domain-containing protein [Acidobacteria bacterium]|nr:zf-HC2 domain-containing protein [Acidobacteriota bacterium]
MLNNEHHIISCELGSEIVAYLYGELSPEERSLFEDHLADCMSCTDEFAAASNARFSVFEWHKEEFVPLATPAFSIPYEQAAEPVRAGWFAGLGELLAFARSPIAIAASLLVVLSLGASVFYFAPFTGTPDKSSVTAPDQKVPAVAVLPNAGESGVLPAQAVDNPKAQPRVVKAIMTTKNKVRTQRYQNLTAQNTPNDNSIPVPFKKKVKKPSLGTYADDEDESLRLAILFDEIGGIRK